MVILESLPQGCDRRGIERSRHIKTDDFRADWVNSLSVAMSDRLALKTSLQLLFDNKPSLLSLPLVDGGGSPTGTTVFTPSDQVDSVVTLTLVIKL